MLPWLPNDLHSWISFISFPGGQILLFWNDPLRLIQTQNAACSNEAHQTLKWPQCKNIRIRAAAQCDVLYRARWRSGLRNQTSAGFSELLLHKLNQVLTQTMWSEGMVHDQHATSTPDILRVMSRNLKLFACHWTPATFECFWHAENDKVRWLSEFDRWN